MTKQLRELNLEVLFHLIAQRRDILLLLPVLAAIAAAAAYKILPAHYESSARLLIQDQQTVNPFMDGLIEEWSAQQRMPLVESIFRSHDTSEQVLRKLGRLSADAHPVEINEAVGEFQKSFEVIPLGGELVLIKVRGETPIEAHESAVALVETFTERILYPQRETLKASAVMFQEQLEQLRADADGDVISATEGVDVNLALEPIGNIRRGLAEAEARLAGIEQEVERAEEKLRRVTPERDRLRGSLARARQRLASLRLRYGDRHPTLAAAEARVQRLEEALRERDEAGENRGRAQLEDAEAAEHQARLVELKEASAEVKLLRQRLLAQQVSKFANGSQVWEVEAPVLPTLPLGSSPWLIIIGAFFAGLLLAAFAIVVLAALNDSIRGERELAEALDAPCLGRMPRGGS